MSPETPRSTPSHTRSRRRRPTRVATVVRQPRLRERKRVPGPGAGTSHRAAAVQHAALRRQVSGPAELGQRRPEGAKSLAQGMAAYEQAATPDSVAASNSRAGSAPSRGLCRAPSAGGRMTSQRLPSRSPQQLRPAARRHGAGPRRLARSPVGVLRGSALES
jgi:hypothetical protein